MVTKRTHYLLILLHKQVEIAREMVRLEVETHEITVSDSSRLAKVQAELARVSDGIHKLLCETVAS